MFIKPRMFFRSPMLMNEAGGAGGGAPAAAAPSAPAAQSSPASTGGSPNTPSQPSGAPVGDSGVQDRARSSKKLNNEFLTSKDNAIHKTRGKVGSLDDIKKLSTKARATGELEGKTVDLDPGAAPGSDPLQSRAEGTPNPEVIPAAKGSAVSTPIEGDPEAEAALEVDPNQYQPNLKYKAYDEEHDIPERFRDLIKDPESEKEVHEVFQKLHGFEKVKENYQNLDKQVRETIVPEVNFFRGKVGEINEALARKDLFGAMKILNVPEEMVLHAVAERVRLMDMPPEQRAMHDARVAAEERERASARQLQSLEARVQESEKLAKRSAFESLLAREDVASVENDFDGRLAKPGAFKQLIVDHGHLVYIQSEGRINLSPEQAYQEVVRKYGLNVTARSAPNQGNPPSKAAPKATAPAQPPTPKIIPNVASNAASTTRARPQINSVDDIRKERKLRFGR